MSPAVASDAPLYVAKASDAAVWLAKATDALANSPIVRKVTLSKNPLAYWRLNDILNVAKDSSGNGHDGTIQGYADLVRSKGANLVGYWRLEETAGAVAADSSGNGRSGTISGGVGLSQVGPLLDPDLAMTFNGTDGVISVTDYAALAFGSATSFSYECWYSWTAGFGPFWKGGSSNASVGFDIENASNGTNVNPGVSDGVTRYTVNTGFSMTGHGIHHVAVVVDRAAKRLHCYVDGVERGVAADITNLGSVSNASALQFGRIGASLYWGGTLDEVAIYNVALSATEVAQHYNAGIVTRMISRGAAGLTPGDPNDAAMRFANVPGAIIQANGVGFGSTGQVSMAAWFVDTDRTTDGMVMGTGQDLNTIFLDVPASGALQFRTTGAGVIADLLTAAGLVAAGQINHAVCTYDGNTKSIYLNGVLRASRAGDAWTNPDGNFTIGGRKPGFSLNFPGTIDEVSIYSRALSAADASDLYLVGKTALGALAVASDARI